MRLQTKAWAQEGWAGAGDVGASTQTWGYKQKMHEPAKEENVEEEGMGNDLKRLREIRTKWAVVFREMRIQFGSDSHILCLKNGSIWLMVLEKEAADGPGSLAKVMDLGSPV